MRETINETVVQKVLKWFGHVARMSGEHLTRRLNESEVVGRRDRCAWIEGSGGTLSTVQ